MSPLLLPPGTEQGSLRSSDDRRPPDARKTGSAGSPLPCMLYFPRFLSLA